MYLLYKKQRLEGTNRPCLLAAVAVTKQSILDLMASSPCQWICSSCRFRDDHEVMLSVVSNRWYLTARSDLVNPVSTNFTVLAEHLLSPLGKHNGLERPDHRAQGGI